MVGIKKDNRNQESGIRERRKRQRKRTKNNVNIKFMNTKQVYLYGYCICKLAFNICKLNFCALICIARIYCKCFV